MSVPNYEPLWQTLQRQCKKPTLFVHKTPQVWASYLSLYSLACQGGRHLFLAKGYEKEAFYRSAYKWLSCVGLESFLTKNGIEIAEWGSLKIMYPLASLSLMKNVKSCLIASPYLFKRQYYQALLDSLSDQTYVWIFHPETLPPQKGDASLRNQIYYKYFWHRQLKAIQLPKKIYDTYEEWALVKVWLNLLCSLSSS